MVKRSDVLARVQAEADLPYERTTLAQRAVPARRRLSLILLLGAALLALETLLTRNPAWLLPAAFVALASWGARRGHLAALIAAGFTALLAILIPFALMMTIARDPVSIITGIVSIAFGASLLPDVILLARDAELQYAYGMWARRTRDP